jgi:hypothetical protein
MTLILVMEMLNTLMLLRKILIELSKKLIDVVVQENTEAGVESLIVLFDLLSFSGSCVRRFLLLFF